MSDKNGANAVCQVVNVAQGMSLGPAMYLWTHRLTNTDVVSVVTTTRPFISNSSKAATLANIGAGSGGGLPVSSVAKDSSCDFHGGPPFSGSFGSLKG